MGKRGQSPLELPHRLKKGRVETAKSLSEQIVKGREIAALQIETHQSLTAAKESSAKWADRNRRILEISFTTKQELDRYNDVPMTIKHVAWGDSFAPDVARFRHQVGMRINKLETLLENLDMLDDPE
jgi:hypothetical protein